MVIEVSYNGYRSIIDVLCGISHHILRVFMLRIFPYILCDIPHYMREDTRLCYRRLPIMVIEDVYNYYLTLFTIILYKLRNILLFLKTFTTLYFSKNL